LVFASAPSDTTRKEGGSVGDKSPKASEKQKKQKDAKKTAKDKK